MKTIRYTSVAVPDFLFLSNSNFYDTAITVSNPYPYVSPQPNQNPGTAGCANSNLQGDFDRDARFGAVVGDSAQYDDYENALNYAAETSVYETLKQNDSLLTLGLSSDASFQTFYNYMSTTNIGTLSDVQAALGSNQIDSAAVINQAVNDTNSIEYARKSVNSIISEKILKNIPNPASETFILKYELEDDVSALVNITDIAGKQIKSVNLDTQKNSMIFSTYGIANGVYFLALNISGCKLKTYKLVIQK